MKIGIVCFPTYGGSGVLATELGKALAVEGHEVHFISYTQPARLDMAFNENLFYHEVSVTNYPLFVYPPYVLSLAGKLIDVVKYEKLDIIHVHYAIPHASAALMAKQILADQGINIPIITTLHGTDISLVGKESLFEPLVSYAINQSNAVTSVSNWLKEETIRHFNIKKEIEVIYNFVDLERFSAKNIEHFKKAIAPDNEFIISHTSNFRKLKRVDNVVNIFAKINAQIPSKLLLVGDGPDRQKTEQQCRDLGIWHDVRFLGKQDAIEEILSVSDLFLMPSETESFGLSALEAMACRVPVISSDAGGLPEVNIHNVTGYCCHMHDIDCMAQLAIDLLSDKEKLEQFKENAYQNALKFDIKKILPDYITLYERVIKESCNAV